MVKKKELSSAINSALGLEVDWTRLRERDLEALVKLLDNPAPLLRHLAKQEVRSRARARVDDLAEEAGSIVGDVLSDRPLGKLARSFLTR